MSEDEMRKAENEEPEEDVEGHSRAKAANEEPTSEGEDDDVEAHGRAKA
jgi:hypothetical protein